jgi:hypothetical protein
MDYLALKHVHMTCAALSGALLLFAYIVTVTVNKRAFL